ncbi:50S ribosomal protein L3 N(5)-glutamine methyltransferase [Ahniella affigens]|uniref:50S ribosomal protein L3 N(5)-glutamine methyltransferase n=1 Tax=Ahniella affigens TaxID=2021234 RepID=A0A2P1PU73_9GAMM|nr:50S ribosomal protein L3 N(5)-glutamine methyltransferase [Ahniella affigens]AVP98394.1 50S ribosomal protein L3 N(5)-glutamine methyltransferase [Ahniella affigens]
MTAELASILDFIRYGASRFAAAGLTFGHGYDNALDEATQLVLHALHLPHDLNPVYGQARLVAAEKAAVLALFERRINERKPACYLTGEAWFAALSFKCDERALVPRSPIAELIEAGFEPWRNGRPLNRVLDLCTGGGCIAIASAHYLPEALVDGVDLSDAALGLAQENADRLLVADRVRLLKSDLFNELTGETYDLIVTNPPYVTRAEVEALPDEYRHEPESGLIAGEDGLDLALRILRDAPNFLNDDGFLICEVGESERALVNLFPQVPFIWIEFKVGQMGIFLLEKVDLLTWHNEFAVVAKERGL